mmetsp:Transcript_23505/g.73560  ORF Transcript_23505/g.73560 Transcript_23505/m.73560 type:complete len:153 (+) Transcript_23505:600-1058(+)
MQLRRLGVVRAHFAAGSRFFQLAGKTQCGLGTQPVCITVSFRSDLPRNYTVHVFCPMCQDIFTPRSSRSASIDGAYFGTTFPHLFLMTFPELAPTRNNQNYVPRVYGFRIHQSSPYYGPGNGGLLAQKRGQKSCRGLQPSSPVPPGRITSSV